MRSLLHVLRSIHNQVTPLAHPWGVKAIDLSGIYSMHVRAVFGADASLKALEQGRLVGTRKTMRVRIDQIRQGDK